MATSGELSRSQPFHGMEARLRHLDTEVTLLGMDTVFIVEGTQSKISLDMTSLVSNSLGLVSLYQKSLSLRESLEDRIRKLESELDHARKMQTRFKESNSDSLNQVALQKESDRRLKLQMKSVQEHSKEARDEVVRLQTEVRQRDSQHRHEKRKLQKELERLKDRLHSVLNNSGGPIRASCIEVLNSLPRMDGRRQAWAKPYKSLDMSQTLPLESDQTYTRQLESKQTEIMMENRDLKHCLFNICKELNKTSQRSENAESVTDDESLFKLPYHFVKERLERELESKFSIIRSGLLSSESHPSAVRRTQSTKTSTSCSSSVFDDDLIKEENRQLKDQVSCYTAIIEKQEQLIKRAFKGFPSRDFVTESKKLRPVQESSPHHRRYSVDTSVI